ncbi:MAG TPA: hypothetical protein VKX49_00175 [Bryobacteraceae bacterium]|jgi:hypothetical protein|nr:hypothetical protein [Bryobacteraceae bacterium]
MNSLKTQLLPAVCSGRVAGLLVSITMLYSGALLAESIPVLHMQGTVRGFLVLRSMEGKTLASGDLTQVARGDRLISNLVFHFKDGSIDETTVFTQHGEFRLVSDRHVQKGPSFPHPMDISIDVSSGQVTVRSSDGGHEKIEKDHLDLPPDLANGLLLTLLQNLRPGATETKISYLAATPKPRLVKLAITPQGQETFRTAGEPHRATRYAVKVELGGIAGALAPLIGKQPKDIYIWILDGKAPAFVRMEGQLYQGGPVWTIELSSPVWQKSERSAP